MSAHNRYPCLRPKQLIVGEGIQAANCFHKEALFALFYLRFSDFNFQNRRPRLSMTREHFFARATEQFVRWREGKISRTNGRQARLPYYFPNPTISSARIYTHNHLLL